MFFCNVISRSLLLNPLNLVKSYDCFEQQNTTEVMLCKSWMQTISNLAASVFYLLSPETPGKKHRLILRDERPKGGEQKHEACQ